MEGFQKLLARPPSAHGYFFMHGARMFDIHGVTAVNILITSCTHHRIWQGRALAGPPQSSRPSAEHEPSAAAAPQAAAVPKKLVAIPEIVATPESKKLPDPPGTEGRVDDSPPPESNTEPESDPAGTKKRPSASEAGGVKKKPSCASDGEPAVKKKPAAVLKKPSMYKKPSKLDDDAEDGGDDEETGHDEEDEEEDEEEDDEEEEEAEESVFGDGDEHEEHAASAPKHTHEAMNKLQKALNTAKVDAERDEASKTVNAEHGGVRKNVQKGSNYAMEAPKKAAQKAAKQVQNAPTAAKGPQRDPVLPMDGVKPAPPEFPMRNGHQFFLRFGRKEHGYTCDVARETWKTFSAAQRKYWNTRATNYNNGIPNAADDLEDLQNAKLAAHALGGLS